MMGAQVAGQNDGRNKYEKHSELRKRSGSQVPCHLSSIHSTLKIAEVQSLSISNSASASGTSSLRHVHGTCIVLISPLSLAYYML